MLELKTIKVKKKDRVYTDLVVIVDGHDFIVKVAPFYSAKARNYFVYLLENSID